MRRLVLALAVIAGLVAGCGSDDGATEQPAVVLDGSPRVPDAEGELVSVADDFSSIELDGGRVFDVSPDLMSFSAADGSVQPLLRWRNQYVQVGLDGDTVEWVGGVSSVVRVEGADPVAYVTGVAIDADEDQIVLRSGTVLHSGGVELPADPPVAVVLTIDVATRRVIEVAPG